MEAAFSVVQQLPQEMLADLEDLVALPITTIHLVEVCSGQHKSQPLEAGTLEGAFSAAMQEDLVRATTSSKPVPLEPPSARL